MRLRFIDRLLCLEPRAGAAALKCVSFEEAMLLRPHLTKGVPPTLFVEWLGQLAALLVAESTDYASLPLLGSFSSCAFGARALAGARCRLEIEVRAWRADGALVDGRILLDEDGPASPGGEPCLEAFRIERALLAFVPLADLWDEAELRAAVRAARGEFPGPVGFR
jgi:hypothetical protein